MSRILSYITSSVWAMRQAELDSMTLIAARNLEQLERIAADAERNYKPDAMTTKPGVRMANTRYTEIREGSVAVIDLNGRIAKRMDFFTEVCEGGTSSETLLKDFQACLDNPNVASIVFNIDSPGGEAFGINEIASHIYAARGKKPMMAYVSGLGCSGAYWIAAACDEIVCDKSAFLGSIGVVAVSIDDTAAYKMLGFDKKVVTSSNAPKKRLDLNKPEDLAEFQSELDAMEKVFIGFVAKSRSKTVEQVKTDFNQGGVLCGADAVKAGMADRTGNLEQVIKQLSKKGKTTASTGAEKNGEINMSFKEKFKELAAAAGFSVTENDEQIAPLSIAPNAESQSAPLIASSVGRVAALETELANLKAERTQEKQSQLKTDAEKFVAGEIKAGRMIPAEKEKFESLFVQASIDDQSSPLAEGSRVDSLKEIQATRKPHNLTEEVLDPKTGLKVLQTDETPTAKMERAAESQAAAYVGEITPNLQIVKSK